MKHGQRGPFRSRPATPAFSELTSTCPPPDHRTEVSHPASSVPPMIHPGLITLPRSACPRLSQAHVDRNASRPSDAANPIPPQGLLPPHEAARHPRLVSRTRGVVRARVRSPCPGTHPHAAYRTPLSTSPRRCHSPRALLPDGRAPNACPPPPAASHVCPSDDARCSSRSGRHSYVQGPCARRRRPHVSLGTSSRATIRPGPAACRLAWRARL